MNFMDSATEQLPTEYGKSCPWEMAVRANYVSGAI